VAAKAAFAQLIEHLALNGVMTDVPETIIFDLNDEGLIRRMSLYVKHGEPAPRLSATRGGAFRERVMVDI
jgi:hypothetical protein